MYGNSQVILAYAEKTLAQSETESHLEELLCTHLVCLQQHLEAG